MKGEVVWTGGTGMNGINEAGQTIEMDWEQGPSPMQLLLQMVGACSLVDVVHSLGERRNLVSARIALEGQRAPEPPRRFTSMKMIYHVVGDDIPEKMVRRVITASHEKYCSVSNSLAEDMGIEWDLVLET